MSTLTPQAIQDAALAIVDESGAHKLTMRAVARRLDVEAPSLYHHVANKSALVDRIVDSILARVEPPEPGADGTDGARGLAISLRAELSAHPNAVSLVASRPSHTLALVDRCDALRDALVRGGLSPTSASHLLRSLVVFTIGHAVAASSVGPEADAWFHATVDALIAGARLDPGADASIATTGREAAADGAKQKDRSPTPEAGAAPPAPRAEEPAPEPTATPSPQADAAPPEQPSAPPAAPTQGAPAEKPKAAPAEPPKAAPAEKPKAAPAEPPKAAPAEKPKAAPATSRPVPPPRPSPSHEHERPRGLAGRLVRRVLGRDKR